MKVFDTHPRAADWFIVESSLEVQPLAVLEQAIVMSQIETTAARHVRDGSMPEFQGGR